jgi:DNA-binding CsgD family transcriptional regulator
MIVPHALDRLIERESFAEIVTLLQPEELLVAVLRLEGLSDVQIGRLLGITRAGVSFRLKQARERISAEAPDLAPLLRGREQPPGKQVRLDPPPLEHGWLCPEEAGWDRAGGQPGAANAGLTTVDVAQRYQVTPQTVTRWVREGRFPNVSLVDAPPGGYRIPEEDLAHLEPV